MFRVDDGRDISDEEFESIVVPFELLCHEFLQKEIMPEFAAFYIAKGYETNSLWLSSYKAFIHDSFNTFNDFNKNTDAIKESTTKLLYEKYGYRIINEDPLELEKVVQDD